MNSTQDQIHTLHIFQSFPEKDLRHLVNELGMGLAHYHTHNRRAWALVVHTYKHVGLTQEVRTLADEAFADHHDPRGAQTPDPLPVDGPSAKQESEDEFSITPHTVSLNLILDDFAKGFTKRGQTVFRVESYVDPIKNKAIFILYSRKK